MTNLHRILTLPISAAIVAILYACTFKMPSLLEFFGLIACMLFPIVIGCILLAKATKNGR